eukprot:1156605-Pelagomonas_calceolata.AAC.4
MILAWSDSKHWVPCLSCHAFATLALYPLPSYHDDMRSLLFGLFADFVVAVVAVVAAAAAALSVGANFNTHDKVFLPSS